MNKLGFVLSLIFIELGTLCIFLTNVLDKTVPMIGKMVSQLSSTQAYSPFMYLVDYKTSYYISSVMIVIGIISSVFFYRREKKCRKSF